MGLGAFLFGPVKPNDEVIYLFGKAKELDADGLDYSQVLERAGRFLVENEAKIDFNLLSKKKNYVIQREMLPVSIKYYLPVDLHKQMHDVVCRMYRITRVKKLFVLKVALSAYVMYLESPTRFIKADGSADINALKLEAISLITKNADDADRLIKIIEILQAE